MCEKKKLEYSWNYLPFPKEKKSILIKFDRAKIRGEQRMCGKKKKLGYSREIFIFHDRKEANFG